MIRRRRLKNHGNDGRLTSHLLFWENMHRANVSLQNADKSHRQWITFAEAQRLEARGSAFRVSRRKDPRAIFRLRVVAQPSNSPNSPVNLTAADLEALVGLRKMNEVLEERLIGWGLLAEKIQKVKSQMRSLYLESQPA